MACKVVLFYNQWERGWTEVFYHPSTDPFVLATNFPLQLFAQAANVRAIGTILKAIRVSQVEPPRKSFLNTLNGGLEVPVLGNQSSWAPDVVSTDAVIRLVSTTGSSRRLYLRGLKDGDVDRTTRGRDNPSARFLEDLNKYVIEIKAAGFCIRKQLRPPAGGLEWFAVTAVAATGAGVPIARLTLNKAPGFDLTSPVMVQFQGIPYSQLPSFPRQAEVIAQSNVAPFSVDIAYPGNQIPVAVQPQKMRLVRIAYAYEPIGSHSFERFSERKTGRPFGSLRGRASAVRQSR